MSTFAANLRIFRTIALIVMLIGAAGCQPRRVAPAESPSKATPMVLLTTENPADTEPRCTP